MDPYALLATTVAREQVVGDTRVTAAPVITLHYCFVLVFLSGSCESVDSALGAGCYLIWLPYMLVVGSASPFQACYHATGTAFGGGSLLLFNSRWHFLDRTTKTTDCPFASIAMQISSWSYPYLFLKEQRMGTLQGDGWRFFSYSASLHELTNYFFFDEVRHPNLLYRWAGLVVPAPI